MAFDFKALAKKAAADRLKYEGPESNYYRCVKCGRVSNLTARIRFETLRCDAYVDGRKCRGEERFWFRRRLLRVPAPEPQRP